MTLADLPETIATAHGVIRLTMQARDFLQPLQGSHENCCGVPKPLKENVHR